MALVPFPGTAPVRDPDDEPQWSPDEEESGGRMSFLEHLDELRKRIINCLIAIAVAMGIAFFFIERIYNFIMVPLAQMLPEGNRHLVYTEPTEAFILWLVIGLLAGVVIASPVIMWQVWLFIAPGLYSHEKRYAIPFIVLSTAGFVGGAAFSHYVLFPWMWRFLASFSTEYTVFMPKIQSVFSLYARMLVAMGLVFQMPAVVYFLARMGVVTARFLIRNLKYAVLIIFIVAAVVTPSADPMGQLLMAAPMMALYGVSIVLAAAFGKKRPKPELQA